MVEESLVLLQYGYKIAEEEFIIKEDGEMEARICRVSLANSCQITQGSFVSSFYGLNRSNIVIFCGYIKPKQG